MCGIQGDAVSVKVVTPHIGIRVLCHCAFFGAPFHDFGAVGFVRDKAVHLPDVPEGIAVNINAEYMGGRFDCVCRNAENGNRHSRG